MGFVIVNNATLEIVSKHPQSINYSEIKLIAEKLSQATHLYHSAEVDCDQCHSKAGKYESTVKGRRMILCKDCFNATLTDWSLFGYETRH